MKLDLYQKDFDLECLTIQLSVLHFNFPIEFHSQTGGMNLKSIIQFLQQLNLSFTQILKLAKFILVMPVTNVANVNVHTDSAKLVYDVTCT